MFRSIVIPLDGSLEAEAALPLAGTIARASGGSVHLLSVAPAAAQLGIEDSVDYLEGLTRDLRNAGVAAHSHVRCGDPAREIVTYARSERADLIVMATRAVGNRSMLALTSVTRNVLTETPAPILLLRPGSSVPGRIHTLLVPIDGSPGGSLAVAAARALADGTGARVVVLQVVVPVASHGFGATIDEYLDPEWEALARATAHTFVEAVARRLNQAGVESEARVATGEVGCEILRCADDVDADMVVMSTHSVTWPARAFLGSVADRVLCDGTRPVLLVRREPPAGETTAFSPQ